MSKHQAIKEEAEGVEAGIEVLWSNLADHLKENDIQILRKMEKRLEHIKQLADELDDEMELIKLIPKTSRAKNRVREHGDTFQVRRRGKPQCFNGRESILLKAADGWIGWFCIEEENWQELELTEKQ